MEKNRGLQRIEPEKVAFFLEAGGKVPVAQLAIMTGVSQPFIYNLLKKHNIGSGTYNIKPAKVSVSRHQYQKSKHFLPDPPKQKIVRPPAVYSNTTPYGIASDYLNQRTA